ncbi:pre-mRNA splicing factor SR-like 1 isoform X1 [Camellia sinensis]|nr:pre-mRNA splicing factor SR-like 1 isoform X1 [Camellia sinensis]
MTGNCRGPSTSFCLLYKFFTMKLTVKQMHGLLKHQDSPYIRCVGFLYLRYAADPKTLWNWFEPYVKDEEEFSPGSSGQVTTMGVYVRDLLLGQYYFDTLFPRIPVPVMRQIVSNLEKMNLPTKHCGVTGESTRGSDDTARRPPSVKAALSVSFGQRAPHRASTRDSSPVRRTMAPPSYDRNGKDDYSRRSPSNRRSQSHDLSDQDYPDRDQDQDRDREWDRNRDRDRGRDSDRKGDRVRERERDRDRGQERDRDRRYDYERRSRESSRREYDKSSRDRRSRSRNRSRSQSNQSHSAHPNHHPSPHRDDNKEKTSASSNLAKLRDLYGDLSSQKEDSAKDRLPNRDSGAEEVIRLGGSKWK